VTPTDHSEGPPDAPLTLLEYGDYECPHCGRAHGIVKELQQRFGDDLRFVFRNFPLTNLHPQAELAAESAEAAGAQDRFWPMHDWLFENQDSLEPESIAAAARAIGVDLRQFLDDLQSRRFEKKVRDDFMSGVRSGVNGTPTFFINGERHNGDYELETLTAALDTALQRAA
jgi:protein-disulfide isomerase